LENHETTENAKLLENDLILIPIDYLFASDKKLFDVAITNKKCEESKLSDAEIAAIAGKLYNDHTVTCKIRKMLPDGRASLKISVADKFLYASVNVKKNAVIMGLAIFRYATSKDPKLTDSTLSSLKNNSNSLAAQLYNKTKNKHAWLKWDLTPDSYEVVQLLNEDEKFSSFSQKITIRPRTETSKLAMARKSFNFLMGSENSSKKMLDTGSSSSIIKDKITIELREELEKTDIIPNLFEEQMPPKISALLKIYNIVGTEAEVKREIIYVYEIILQLIFPQKDSVIGALIAAWNKDKDKISNLNYKTAFMDLLTVLNMLCLDKKFVEGPLRKSYPNFVVAAEVVMKTFVLKNDPKQNASGTAATHTSGTRDFSEDVAIYKRRFAKLNKNVPKINRAVLYT